MHDIVTKIEIEQFISSWDVVSDVEHFNQLLIALLYNHVTTLLLSSLLFL